MGEATSRQFIDAILLPICFRTGLQLVLEAKLHGGTMTVSGYADYLMRSRSKRRGGADDSKTVALVEAKRCDTAWSHALSQATAQAVVQLMSLESSEAESSND